MQGVWLSSQAQQLSSLPTYWLAVLVDQSDLLLAGVQAECCLAKGVICKQPVLKNSLAPHVTDTTLGRCSER